MLAYMDNFPTDIGDESEQTKFIHCLNNSMDILKEVRKDRLIDPESMRYNADQFFTTIQLVIHDMNLLRKPAATTYHALTPSQNLQS